MAEDRESIQTRMLENIQGAFDKSEGSFFYDVLKPVAMEIEAQERELEKLLEKIFIESAYGIFLDKKAAEQGIYRKQATKARTKVKITGIGGAKINKGERVASDQLTFVFTEDSILPETGEALVTVECEWEGKIGNVPVGAIQYFPVTLEGLYTVTNPEEVTNGYEGEGDEELRQRYYDKVRTPATSGNKYHYLNWAKEVTGVGAAKVFPLWNGNGTVKVAIINENKRAADNTLVEEVRAHIEENRPIGAIVTTISATEKPINITVALVIDTKKYTLNQVQGFVQQGLIAYFQSIAFVSDYVSYASIGNILFNTEGVIDYNHLLVNNGTTNIQLVETEIPILGTLDLEVI